MEPIFKYTSLAAGSIANEMGFLHDSVRVQRLTYALYEAALAAIGKGSNGTEGVSSADNTINLDLFALHELTSRN